MCFEEFGGLKNNAGAGVTGDVLATTEGWGSGTKSFTVILEFKKHGASA
jgi:predicted aconitase with swiveling domain